MFAHTAGPLMKQHRGGYGSDDLSSSQALSNASKIINGLTLLMASKSPAEDVGRLVAYNKKYSLHRFTWTGDTVTVKHVPVHAAIYDHTYHINFANFRWQQGRWVCTCWQPFWQAVLCSVFWRLLANHFDVPIHVRSFRFSQIPHASNWHTIVPI